VGGSARRKACVTEDAKHITKVKRYVLGSVATDIGRLLIVILKHDIPYVYFLVFA